MSRLLKKLEKKIDVNRDKAWYENNLILLKIRNESLYLKKHKTFELYLEDRWDISRRRGYQLMDSAEFMLMAVKKHTEIVHKNEEIVHNEEPVLPKNEGQVRPLIEKAKSDGEKLNNGEKLHVWDNVVKSEKPITAKLVQEEVDAFIASGDVIVDVEYIEKEILIGNKAHVSRNSGVNEWYTPEKFVCAARSVMGSIDCDPATSLIANETVKAEKMFTEMDNGLNQIWAANVWMNPPYAQPLIGSFAETISLKFEAGEVLQACVLVNNATETKWFQRMLAVSSAVCFTASRIKFLDPEGKKSGAPLQGQAILYMGNQSKKFALEFEQFGRVLFNGI